MITAEMKRKEKEIMKKKSILTQTSPPKIKPKLDNAYDKEYTK